MNEDENNNMVSAMQTIMAMSEIAQALNKTTSDPNFAQNLTLQLKAQTNSAKISLIHKTILTGLDSKDMTAWEMFLRMSNLIYGGSLNELEAKSVLLKFVMDEIERRVGPVKKPSSPETTKESFPA